MDLRVFIVCFISFEFVICAPISEDQINAECAKIRLEMKNIEPAKVEDELYRKAAIARIEKEEDMRKVGDEMKKVGDEMGQLRHEKDKYKNIVAAVVGRNVLEDFYKMDVEPYLKIKSVNGTTPMPSGTDIVQAYEDYFMDDTQKVIAQRFLRSFPGLTKKQVAEKVRKLYWKLSRLNHTYLDTLKKTSTFSALLDLLNALPAMISDEEIFITETILYALNDDPNVNP